jgi:hypothetical protein
MTSNGKESAIDRDGRSLALFDVIRIAASWCLSANFADGLLKFKLDAAVAPSAREWIQCYYHQLSYPFNSLKSSRRKE